MKTFMLTITVLIASQAGADVVQTCKDWKEQPVIKEYNGKSYAVGQANCKVADSRPIPGNQTHGLRPTELFCLYTKRDDVQACNDDGEVGIFDSKTKKIQAAETKAAYKLYLAEKKQSEERQASRSSNRTQTADSGQ